MLVSPSHNTYPTSSLVASALFCFNQDQDVVTDTHTPFTYKTTMPLPLCFSYVATLRLFTWMFRAIPNVNIKIVYKHFCMGFELHWHKCPGTGAMKWNKHVAKLWFTLKNIYIYISKYVHVSYSCQQYKHWRSESVICPESTLLPSALTLAVSAGWLVHGHGSQVPHRPRGPLRCCSVA